MGNAMSKNEGLERSLKMKTKPKNSCEKQLTYLLGNVKILEHRE